MTKKQHQKTRGSTRTSSSGSYRQAANVQINDNKTYTTDEAISILKTLLHCDTFRPNTDLDRSKIFDLDCTNKIIEYAKEVFTHDQGKLNSFTNAIKTIQRNERLIKNFVSEVKISEQDKSVKILVRYHSDKINDQSTLDTIAESWKIFYEYGNDITNYISRQTSTVVDMHRFGNDSQVDGNNMSFELPKTGNPVVDYVLEDTKNLLHRKLNTCVKFALKKCISEERVEGWSGKIDKISATFVSALLGVAVTSASAAVYNYIYSTKPESQLNEAFTTQSSVMSSQTL